MGYAPWGHIELDTTEATCDSIIINIIINKIYYFHILFHCVYHRILNIVPCAIR